MWWEEAVGWIRELWLQPQARVGAQAGAYLDLQSLALQKLSVLPCMNPAHAQ